VQEDLSIYRIIQSIYKLKASISVISERLADPTILQDVKQLYAKSTILLTDKQLRLSKKLDYSDLLVFLNRDDKKNLYGGTDDLQAQVMGKVRIELSDLIQNQRSQENRSTESTIVQQKAHDGILKKMSSIMMPQGSNRKVIHADRIALKDSPPASHSDANSYISERSQN